MTHHFLVVHPPGDVPETPGDGENHSIFKRLNVEGGRCFNGSNQGKN
jgi:hypothetical protein